MTNMNNKPKILIVDDKIENLIALESVLAGFGAEFIRALSGNDALLKCLSNDFALALIDVQMPGMDGFELVEIMRQSKNTMYVPVIFLSAIYKEEFYVIKGIETGAVDFISKPIAPEILKGKVRVFLNLYNQKKHVDDLLALQKELYKELKVANEKAEAATNAKSLYLASMSHEIRTPLNGIIGMLDLLFKTELAENQQKIAHIIRLSSNNLQEIINDILDFSKIEAGHVDLESIKFELKKEVEEVVKMLSFRAEQTTVDLVIEFDENIPQYIVGDPMRFRQILINLVNNALKFTSNGKVTIHVKLISTLNSQNLIRIDVVDTGIGISEEGQQKLFKSFSQVETSTTRQFGGTGLGLAISKSLVELMNGEIGVHSKIGEGSTFWFQINFGVCDSVAISTTELIGKAQVTDDQKKIRILLAEDNLINQKVALFNLNRMGFDVEVAENGRIACQMFKDNNFDLILMDIQMPEMDGVVATKEIRKFENENSVPQPVIIVAMTANALKGDREKYLAAGMNDYISKPYKPDELEEVIRSKF